MLLHMHKDILLTSTILTSLFSAAVFFSPFLDATTVHTIAGSDHSGLTHIRALTPINEATTVSKRKKMYSFGAPIASACPSIVRMRDGLQHFSQSRVSPWAELILAFTSGVSFLAKILAKIWAAMELCVRSDSLSETQHAQLKPQRQAQ